MDEAIGAVAMGVLFVVFGWLHRRRVARAFRAEAHCVACDATDLELLAPEVYRCNACGHEGGDGEAAHARARREASFRAMDPVERRKSGRRDLREVRRLLSSALGELERARGLGDSLFEDTRRTGSSELGSVMATATGLLLEAREKARDAQVKLGTSLGAAATADLGDGADPARAAFSSVSGRHAESLAGFAARGTRCSRRSRLRSSSSVAQAHARGGLDPPGGATHLARA